MENDYMYTDLMYRTLCDKIKILEKKIEEFKNSAIYTDDTEKAQMMIDFMNNEVVSLISLLNIFEKLNGS